MPRLEKKLQDWVSLEIISRDQARSILQHEEKTSSSSWIVYSFLILGAFTIGIGVISLIAANWQSISDVVKLGTDFFLLCGNAFWIYKSWDSGRRILLEVLLVLYLILCLASIGLISQIYHTGGKIYEALLLWSMITLGMALISKRSFSSFLWVSGFLIGLSTMLIDASFLQSLFGKNEIAVFMLLPLLSALFALLSQQFFSESRMMQAFIGWIFLTGICALVLLESSINIDNKTIYLSYLPTYIIAVLVAAGIFMSSSFQPSQRKILLWILALFLVSFHLPWLDIKSSVIYAGFTITILGLTAIYFANAKNQKVFQIFLFLIGLRFVVLYFQALGGLATTGLGLIASGVMIIGLVVCWNKYRNNLAQWAEEI